MVFERKILRKIFGPTYENGPCRIKTNQELDKLIKHKNTINFARAFILKECKNQEWSKQYTLGNPFQRGQWEDQRNLKKDVQRLKVPNWKTLFQDRRRWKEVVEKAKTLH